MFNVAVLLQFLLILLPAVVPSFVIEKDLEGKLLFPKVKDSNKLAGAVHSFLIAKYSESCFKILQPASNIFRRS
jgi:hypothetical protein